MEQPAPVDPDQAASTWSGEAEYLLCELPLELREQLPDTKAVKPRLAALARRNRRRRYDAPTRLRLRLLDGYRAQIKALDGQEREVVAELEALVRESGSTLGELCGLSTRSVAELLVEVGDPRRFTEGGFARFNGSAPLPASTAEGPGEPVRHRYNPGGNRRINAILHRMAVTQLRCEPRAQRIYANARAGGHTKKEARRDPQAPPLRRHLPAHDPRPRRASPPNPSSLHNRASTSRAVDRQVDRCPRMPSDRLTTRLSATSRLQVGAFLAIRPALTSTLPLT